jgi:glycosyltransferase involved in cell wall biosynthesis
MLRGLCHAGRACDLFCLEAVPSGSRVPAENRQWEREFFGAASVGRSGMQLAADQLSLTTPHFRSTFSPRSFQQLQHIAAIGGYEAIVCFELGAADYVRRLRNPPTKVFDACEPFMFAYGGGPRGLLRRLRFVVYLRRVLTAFDAYTCVSREELAWTRRVAGGLAARGYLVPNGADPPTPPGNTAVDFNRVIYTGTMRYRANYDAADYLVRQVWPVLHSRLPNAHLVVTGELPASLPSDLLSVQGVTFAGLIPEYPAFVSSSAVLIVPVFAGGGTRVKILDAFARGCAVVSSPKGAEGLAVQHDRDLLIAKTPEEFASAAERIMTIPELRARLVAAGRQVAIRNSWRAAQDELVKAVDIAKAHAGRGARV